MSIFKKKKEKGEDKSKESDKEEKKAEKQLDELIQSSSNSERDTASSKSASSSFYFDNIEIERRIISEILKDELNSVDPIKLYEQFALKLKNWNYSKRKDDYRPA